MIGSIADFWRGRVTGWETVYWNSSPILPALAMEATDAAASIGFSIGIPNAETPSAGGAAGAAAAIDISPPAPPPPAPPMRRPICIGRFVLFAAIPPSYV